MNIHPQFERRIRPELLPVLNETEAGSTAEAFGDDALLDGYSRTISAVVNRVAPSVVNIRVEGRGGGSGFIIARDGFILTNSHVVHGGTRFEITLHDTRTFAAQLFLMVVPRELPPHLPRRRAGGN